MVAAQQRQSGRDARQSPPGGGSQSGCCEIAAAMLRPMHPSMLPPARQPTPAVSVPTRCEEALHEEEPGQPKHRRRMPGGRPGCQHVKPLVQVCQVAAQGPQGGVARTLPQLRNLCSSVQHSTAGSQGTAERCRGFAAVSRVALAQDGLDNSARALPPQQPLQPPPAAPGQAQKHTWLRLMLLNAASSSELITSRPLSAAAMLFRLSASTPHSLL